MQSMSDLIKQKKIEKSAEKKRKANELHESVNLIIAYFDEVQKERPSYGFLCRRVKQTKKSYFDVERIVKDAKNLPEKYNKIGYIINQIKTKKRG